MLNTQYMKLNFIDGLSFKVGEREKVPGQPVYIWPIIGTGNWSIRRRRSLGVLVVSDAPTYSVTGATIASGGSGYEASDVLSVPRVSGDTPATLTVTSVNSSGAITAASITTAGKYAADGTGAGVAVAGGTGSGATFNITMG